MNRMFTLAEEHCRSARGQRRKHLTLMHFCKDFCFMQFHHQQNNPNASQFSFNNEK